MTEYQEKVDLFDGWINALLRGANTSEGRIAAIDNVSLRNAILAIDKLHNERFNLLSEKFMADQKKLAGIKVELGKADELGDSIGNKMTSMLGGVEDGAKVAVNAAANSSKAITESALTQIVSGVIIGFIIALGLGILITRSITRPINMVIDGVGEELSSQSESLKDLVDRLSEIIGGTGSQGQSSSVHKTTAVKHVAAKKASHGLLAKGKPTSLTRKPGAATKGVKPNEVIPMNEDEFREF